MSIYELGVDEAVILQDSQVFFGLSMVTLILTNQNIIQVNKGFFGRDKEAWKYPLLDLKVLNGKPNVRIGKSGNGRTQLELYFQGYERAYSFQELRGERKWLNAITKAYKEAVAEKNRAEKSMRGAARILSPLKGTIDSAKNAISSKTKNPRILMMKCPKCGAELAGEKGAQVTCSYCEALVTIR